jgi:hypothetical protein
VRAASTRSAAAGVLAAAALTACGSDGGSSATESFCEEYRQIEEELAEVDFEDPAALSEAFDRMSELDPPDEIADDFRAVVELNREVYSAGDGVDLSDQEAATELQEQLSERATDLEDESQNVDEFLAEECELRD